LFRTHGRLITAVAQLVLRTTSTTAHSKLKPTYILRESILPVCWQCDYLKPPTDNVSTAVQCSMLAHSC